MENEKKSNGTLVGILIGLVIALIIGGCLLATGTISFKISTTNNSQTSENKKNQENNVLSEEEALKIGKELYDKTTKVYETWYFIPYCGVYHDEVYKKKMVDFGKATRMYESEFKDLDELKTNLATFLSEEIINQHIKDEAITDLSILEQDNMEYTNYVISNNKLYCRSFAGKGWLSRYLDKYDMTISTIKNDIIIYNVKLTNVNEFVAAQTNSKCTYDSKMSDCTPDQLEYIDTKFIIQKINGKWIVTDYILHN